MSEEVKKPEPVTRVEKISEKHLEKIEGLKKEIDALNNEFFQLSTQIVGIQKKLNELYDKRQNKAESIQATIKDAGKKLKLDKRKDFNWRYNGTDSFIGVSYTAKPEPIKPEEKTGE